MSLTGLWLHDREEVAAKHIQQIISFAGQGKLRDESEASKDLREFLAHVPLDLLARYADECLRDRFEDSGLALQDIVNQVGRRLGFEVEYGRYRGTRNGIGYDGIWRGGDTEIVVEVKTTDAYRIRLDSIAEYRKRLVEEGRITGTLSSDLIVVSRQDTGDLEAQVRGSRHAWDIRLISVDALLNLMRLKEELEDPIILEKISGILTPQEFTRVDGIIDLVFLTAEDVTEEGEADEAAEVVPEPKKPKLKPVQFHEESVARIEEHLSQDFVRRSRARYKTPDERIALLCAVSRAHDTTRGPAYWFGFHPEQREYLERAEKAYIAFGCGSASQVLLIPYEQFATWIPGFNVTEGEDRMYWHVHITNEEEERWILDRKTGFESVEISRYLLPTPSSAPR